ncbi:MAG TPA: response regulator [Bacteroidales bacterium]|nr:response regulator [Bacteroidales bacterium]
MESNWEERKILVVEDDDTNFLYISALIKKKKVQLIRSKDGLDAFFLCMTAPPDIVIMDIRLPIMNGFDSIRLIKKYEPTIPIITLTASAMNEDRMNAIDAGCDAFVTKPILPDELIGVIEYFLTHPRSAFKFFQSSRTNNLSQIPQ